MIALLLNHLWQSSLCLAVAGLLTLALRRNGAHVRFWLWFAASVKFLLPFALLTAAGTYLLTPYVPPQPAAALIEPLAVPFSAPSTVVTIPANVPSPVPAIALTIAESAPTVPRLDLETVLLTIWLAGFMMIILRWLLRWSRLRAKLRDAVTVEVDAPIAVKFSASPLEPGLAGILKPVILLPRGIEQQLSAVELHAVLAHELCHWRRHDNLLAAVHMLVEALFWFFPLVWWLGARLNAERERACDERVLAEGNDPQQYAEGILKVCRAYLQSPLACVAGVSGGGLKTRIDAIMENPLIPRLNAARKLVLGASAALVLAVPLALALATVPVAEIQAKAAQVLTPIAQITAPVPLSEPAPIQRIASAPPVARQPENLTPPSPNLPALPNGTLATPVVPAESATQTLPDVGASMGLLPYIFQSVDSTPPVARQDLSTEHVCFNSEVTGRVLSPRAILIGSFTCQLQRAYPSRVIGEQSFGGFIMNVELPSDTQRMARGTVVTIGADFKVLVKNEVRYLVSDNARILSLDAPPSSPAPSNTPPTETDQAAAAPSTTVASNVQPIAVSTANAPRPRTTTEPRKPDFPFGLQWTDHNRVEAISYCRQLAQLTVEAGANTPIVVDKAFKQRAFFFYWHCMFGSGQIKIDPPIRFPAYEPLGEASADNPANFSGTFAISSPPWPATRTCTFQQSGNVVNGRCEGPEGSGPAYGVVDGRQVRWSWQFSSGQSSGELDFIGSLDSSSVVTGRSVLASNPRLGRQIESFRATFIPS